LEDPQPLPGHSPFKWREHMRRAVASRRVFPYLAVMTIGLGVLAGFLVTLLDKKDFPTFGTGVWWAIVTLGTVGYGDVVPHTAWGRVLGSGVIVVGVTFIAFLTATVTSYFVAAEDEESRAASHDEIVGGIAELVEVMAGIEGRLAAIENKLDL